MNCLINYLMNYPISYFISYFISYLTNYLMNHPISYLIAALLAAGLVVLLDRLWLYKVMHSLEKMLDNAICGAFSVEHYDETYVSAIEARFARYLDLNSLSSRQLAEEKKRIQGLVSDISHQTKMPIASILLYTELLQEHELDDECRESAEALSAQAAKLQFLMDSLIKASRLEMGIIAVQPRIAELQPCIVAATAEAGPDARAKGISLTCSTMDLTARFDPKWTQEALSNLLDNAIKYTPSGGCVTVSATAYEMFSRINVSDTGTGIAENDQGHIFERFYRAPSARDVQGVGLGLYLAREIISLQGGYIKVASKPGEGSTFSIFLPRP